MRNSWPTAPVTPTIAMRGPVLVLAAFTTTTRWREALEALVAPLPTAGRWESCILPGN